jgi:hypothetical protein
MTSPAEVNPEVHDYLTQFLRAVFGESVWQ